jgi:hypothetical protein
MKKGIKLLCAISGLMLYWIGTAQADVSLMDWVGEYRGFIDGRPATLTIKKWNVDDVHSCMDSVAGGLNSYLDSVNIELRDVQRNVIWSRSCVGPHSATNLPAGHVWRNLSLRQGSARYSTNVGTFFLHTWDHDFISGYNTWNGKDYGRLFIRTTRSLPGCSNPHDPTTCRFR